MPIQKRLLSLVLLAGFSCGCFTVRASGHANAIATSETVGATQQVRGGFGLTLGHESGRVSALTIDAEVGALESTDLRGATLGGGVGVVSAPDDDRKSLFTVDLLTRALVATKDVSHVIAVLEVGYYPWISGDTSHGSCHDKFGCNADKTTMQGWGLTAGMGVISDRENNSKAGFIQLGFAWKIAQLLSGGGF